MKTQILKLTAMVIIPAALLAFTSCSSTCSSTSKTQPEKMSVVSDDSAATPTIPTSTSDTPSPEVVRGGVVLDAVQATATVDSIDAATRTVGFRRSDGSLSSYTCGPEVRNFDQIKVGDQVTVTVAESLAIVLVKGGVPPAAGTASAIVRAPLGAKPGGKIVDTVGFTAKVISVDVQNRQVVLQTMDGENKTVKVGPDIDLTNVNPGDDVGVRLTRAFAVAVTTPEK